MRLLALQDVDQLGPGEGGVEVEQVGAELGNGQRRVDEPTVVAAHDRHRVALADTALGQRAGERVAAAVHLTEGDRPSLVDDAVTIGVEHGHRVEATGGTGAPGGQHPAEGDQLRGQQGPHDSGPDQHLGRRTAVGRVVDDRSHEVQHTASMPRTGHPASMGLDKPDRRSVRTTRRSSLSRPR